MQFLGHAILKAMSVLEQCRTITNGTRVPWYSVAIAHRDCLLSVSHDDATGGTRVPLVATTWYCHSMVLEYVRAYVRRHVYVPWYGLVAIHQTVKVSPSYHGTMVVWTPAQTFCKPSFVHRTRQTIKLSNCSERESFFSNATTFGAVPLVPW